MNRFKDLGNLQNLTISYGIIENIEDYTFAGLSNLMYLNMKKELKSLNTKLSSLVVLHLEDNRLYFPSAPPKYVFRPLISLQELYSFAFLKHRKFRYIDTQ